MDPYIPAKDYPDEGFSWGSVVQKRQNFERGLPKSMGSKTPSPKSRRAPSTPLRHSDRNISRFDFAKAGSSYSEPTTPNRVNSTSRRKISASTVSNLKRSDSNKSNISNKSVQINTEHQIRRYRGDDILPVREDDIERRCEFPSHIHDEDITDLDIPVDYVQTEDNAGTVAVENKRHSMALSINSGTDTYVGGHHMHSHLSQLDTKCRSNITETTDECLIQHQQDKTKVLVKTKGWTEAESKLCYHRKVVLSSEHGCGKTFLAKELLLNYAKKEEKFKLNPMILRFPSEWKMSVSPKDDVIILLDDIFGKYTVDQEKLEQWGTLFPDIHTCINSNSSSVHVIITIRDNIFRQIKNVLSCYDLFNDIDKMVVKLTLDNEDKYKMCRSYLYPESLNLKDENEIFIKHLSSESEIFVREILKIPRLFAFPLCCAKYVEKYNTNKSIDFFSNPLKVILSEFRNICMNDIFAFFVLSLILFSPDQYLQLPMTSETSKSLLTEVADVFDIKNSYQNLLGQIDSKLRELNNIYIFDDNNRIYFISDAILGVMIHIVGEKYINCLINKLEFSVLLKYTTVTQARNDEFVINPRNFDTLTDRYLIELKNGLVKDIVRSEAMEDANFVTAFVLKLKNCRQYIKWQGREKGVESILYLAIMHKPPRQALVCEIMKHGPKIKKGTTMKQKYKKWFRKEVLYVLKCHLEQGDGDLVVMLSSFFKPLPNEILYVCAKCSDNTIYEYFLNSYPWSTVCNIKARIKRKFANRQQTTNDDFADQQLRADDGISWHSSYASFSSMLF